MSKLPAYVEQFVLILLAAACYSFFLPGNRCPLPDRADTSPSRLWVFPFLASVRSLPSLFFFLFIVDTVAFPVPSHIGPGCCPRRRFLEAVYRPSMTNTCSLRVHSLSRTSLPSSLSIRRSTYL
ncbi:hypothetical protein JB92DRAFT_1954502 [Gautieria morchelliformis]|nr:hypothetical protein JB92DRAFT_1954502 [Gautieria morchelliformis]